MSSLSIEERLRIVAMRLGVPSKEFVVSVRKYVNGLHVASQASVYRWFDGKTSSVDTSTSKIINDAARHIANDLIGESSRAAYNELPSNLITCRAQEIINYAQRAPEELREAVSVDTYELISAGAKISRECTLPSRLIEKSVLNRIIKHYCGVWLVFRKRSRQSGVVREAIKIEYQQNRFNAKYYYANGEILEGYALFENQQISLVFSKIVDDDYYRNFIVAKRNDRSKLLSAIGCSPAWFTGNDPGARRIVLAKARSGEISETPTGLIFEKGQKLEATANGEYVCKILDFLDRDSIVYYAAVKNKFAASNDKDYILINNEHYSEEQIRRGERIWDTLITKYPNDEARKSIRTDFDGASSFMIYLENTLFSYSATPRNDN